MTVAKEVLATLSLARQMSTAVMEPASIKLVVPTAPPRPSARDKDAVRYRVVNERRLPKPPKSQHWVSKHFMVYTITYTIYIYIHIMYLGRTHADFLFLFYFLVY